MQTLNFKPHQTLGSLRRCSQLILEDSDTSFLLIHSESREKSVPVCKQKISNAISEDQYKMELQYRNLQFHVVSQIFKTKTVAKQH